MSHRRLTALVALLACLEVTASGCGHSNQARGGPPTGTPSPFTTTGGSLASGGNSTPSVPSGSPADTARGGLTLRNVDWARANYPISCGTAGHNASVTYMAPSADTELALVVVACVAGAGTPPIEALVYDRALSPTSAHILQTLVRTGDYWLYEGQSVGAGSLSLNVEGYSSAVIVRSHPDIATTLTWQWSGDRYTLIGSEPTHEELPEGG